MAWGCQSMAEHKGEALRERVNVGATIVLTVATIALACYTAGLFNETRRLAADANTNAHRQLRAYVSVELAEPLSLDQGFNSVRLSLVNNGATPAVNVVAMARVFPAVPYYVETPDGRVWNFPAKYVSTQAGPTDETHYTRSKTIGVLTRTASDSFWVDDHRLIGAGDLIKGQRHLVIVGAIYYDDTFGESHWSVFCLQWSPENLRPDGAAYCNNYNETDATRPEMPLRGPLVNFGYKATLPDPK